MDLSALIFVALAMAWAVYLVPKALKHHEDSAASRSIDGFSDRLRVLARREPVDRKTARLVVEGQKPAAEPVPVVRAPMTAQQARAHRAASMAAARRRRKVVSTILVAIIVTLAVATAGYLSMAYAAIPTGVLLVWLVLCRVMVRREAAVFVPAPRRTSDDVEVDDGDLTEEFAAVAEPLAEPAAVEAEAPVGLAPGEWAPMPVTLPTYVSKEPAARRSVRTIDLDSTGVWTSGRSAADSALAREAEAVDRAAKAATEKEGDRATGS